MSLLSKGKNMGQVNDYDGLEEETGWLCACGNWEETEGHCRKCGRQPPWGCDCCQCQDEDTEEVDVYLTML